MTMSTKKIKLLCLLFFFFILLNLSYSSTTLIVTEEDLIRLKPSAIDPDDDSLSFQYLPPLNETGEWQTTLNDSGTYHTKVIASDGHSQTEEEILLIVKNKNQPPKIEKRKIVIEENEVIDLKELISDPDDDPLRLLFQKPFDKDGIWQTTYEDAGTHQTKIIASDLEYKTTETIEIEVRNKNRPPQILSSFSSLKLVPLKEDTTFSFYVEADDPDQDTLQYSWQLDEKELSQQPSFDYYFDFTAAGEHKLALTVSDSEFELKELWALKIENTNRPPEIRHPDIVVNEGDKIILQLPETDADHDSLTYTFSPPFQTDGTWQTTYEDAGTYTALITATDGELTDEKELEITINDVDRPPVISLPQKITLNEDERLLLNLPEKISDPDGDSLKFTVEGLPEDALFTGQTVKWQPGYHFVQREPNFLTNFLNRLRIEKYFFLQHKKVALLVEACGKSLCTNHSLILQVNNVNREPLLNDLPEIIITETETALLVPEATDLDNDYLKYYFEKPFNKKGEWQTTYDDQAEFFTNVTASDGTLTDTRAVKVTVKNKNRPPTLDIKKDYYKLNELQTLSFKLGATDPDGDNLTVYIAELPSGASFQEQIFSWTPSYETVKERQPTFLNNLYARSSLLNRRYNHEYKQFTLRFTATDNEFYTIHPVLVTVKNVNQPPEISDYSPAQEIITQIGEPALFFAAASDPDQENLTYHWSFGPWDKSVTGSNKLQRTFKTPGYKTVKFTATDGTYSDTQEWKVKVNPSPVYVIPTPSLPLPPSPPPPTHLAPSPPPSLPLPPQPVPQFKVYVIEG